MRTSEAARHYARVLLDVAVREGDDLDALADGLDVFAAAVAGSPASARALSSPAAPRSRRAHAAAEAARRAAPDPATADRLARFVSVMVERDRSGEFEATAREFRAALDVHRGVMEAEVTSARRLDSGGRDAVRAALEAVFEGRRARLRFREDPSLLGGFTVRAGNRIFDASISGKLDRFLAAHGAGPR